MNLLTQYFRKDAQVLRPGMLFNKKVVSVRRDCLNLNQVIVKFGNTACEHSVVFARRENSADFTTHAFFIGENRTKVIVRFLEADIG